MVWIVSSIEGKLYVLCKTFFCRGGIHPSLSVLLSGHNVFQLFTLFSFMILLHCFSIKGGINPYPTMFCKKSTSMTLKNIIHFSILKPVNFRHFFIWKHTKTPCIIWANVIKFTVNSYAQNWFANCFFGLLERQGKEPYYVFIRLCMG